MHSATSTFQCIFDNVSSKQAYGIHMQLRWRASLVCTTWAYLAEKTAVSHPQSAWLLQPKTNQQEQGSDPFKNNTCWKLVKYHIACGSACPFRLNNARGVGETKYRPGKMINFGMFSGQITSAYMFASLGHLPPIEARKAIKASLDLATAKYGNLFTKAVGWNVRRTSAKACSPVWPAEHWQYYPEKPFPLN